GGGGGGRGVGGVAGRGGGGERREAGGVARADPRGGGGWEARTPARPARGAGGGGASRRYIEEEIPHIASLMCASAEALLAHAEVIVLGNACEDANEVLAATRPDHVTVDLTRGHATRTMPRGGGGG